MKKTLSYFLGILLILIATPVLSATLSTTLSGRILLQVESKGEAWYVYPQTGQRYYLGRPSDAFALMRQLGQGISNANLAKIPVETNFDYGIDIDHDGLGDALENAIRTNLNKVDSDGDGHDDLTEIAAGFNPLGSGKLPIDLNFTQKILGRIFLQVENKGQAWYVSPVNKKRYFLGRPDDAFRIMRALGLGITNVNLQKIGQANVPPTTVSALEKLIFDDVNQERTKAGLKPLVFSSELSVVARTQSNGLADENVPFSGLGRACDYPLIHHENIKIGFMNSDRLSENGVYYYSQAGENIALYSAASYKVSFTEGDPAADAINNCSPERERMGTSFKSRLDAAKTPDEKKAIIRAEIVLRTKLFESQPRVETVSLVAYENSYLSAEITRGWMESKGHRENILHAEYDEAGMGVVIANGYVYATQVFIKRADCGFKTGKCCEKTGYYPYCFEGLKCREGMCGL